MRSITDRVWDRSRPPPGPFTLNRDCPQALGLVQWYPGGLPLFPADAAGSHNLTAAGAPTLGLDIYGAPVAVLGGTSDWYADAVAPVVTAHPLSLAAWVRPDDVSTFYQAIGISQSGTATGNINRCAIRIETSAVSSAVVTGDSGTQALASSASTVTAATWNLFGGRFTSTASRTAYLNGVAGTTETSALASDFGTLNCTSIGVLKNDNATFFAWKGQIGECMIWNIDVGDAVMQRIADPGYRFELWYPLRSRRWISFAPAASFKPAWARQPSQVVGGGVL